MALIIDSHLHVFPDRLQKIAPAMGGAPVGRFRRAARSWMRPFTASMHKTQPWLRLLPPTLRRSLDSLGALAPLPNLLFESTPQDLSETLTDVGVHYAAVIAHPPWIPNDFVMQLAQEDPRILAVVNIPAVTAEPEKVLREYVEHGARALKIHPAADGEGADSARYRKLLEVANELKLPVIIHTGCIHSALLYKDADQGRAELFEPWFKDFPKIKFVLAHMNLHEPAIALDLAERYSNVYVDTSWQPAEMIGEAVRRIGAKRVMFGSDWPFLGNNLKVGVDRIRDCVDTGMFGEAEAKLVLGENAAKLFGVKARAV